MERETVISGYCRQIDNSRMVCVAGRMMSRRIMGKASFIDLHDCAGRIQVYVSRGDVGEDVYAGFKKWDIGDIMGDLDGSGLDIHHYCTSTFDAVIAGDVLPQCSICNVLNVDVKGRSDIQAVLYSKSDQGTLSVRMSEWKKGGKATGITEAGDARFVNYVITDDYVS